MLKKLLTLSLVAVMLSTVAFANSVLLAEPTYAADAVTEVSCPLEMIKVTSGTPPTLAKMTSGAFLVKSGSTWIYAKCDLSELASLEEIKSAVLSLGINFKTKGTLRIRELDKTVWDAAKTVVDGGTVADTSIFANPYSATDTLLASMYAEGGNTNGTTNRKYYFTDYAYSYKKEYWASSKVQEWRGVNMYQGTMSEKIKTVVNSDAITDKTLYFSISFSGASGADVHSSSTYSKIDASSDVMVLYNSNYVAYTGTTFYPEHIVYNWPSGLDKETGSFTTKTISTDFRYSALVAPAGTKVRLLCAIYDENGALLGVEASEVLTAGTDVTSFTVPLATDAKYATAKSVKCFLWDGETLRPYTDDFLEKAVEIPAAE